MLENIERNIERSVEYAFKAKDDIVSAQKMKRRAQMVRFFLLIFFNLARCVLPFSDWNGLESNRLRGTDSFSILLSFLTRPTSHYDRGSVDYSDN